MKNLPQALNHRSLLVATPEVLNSTSLPYCPSQVLFCSFSAHICLVYSLLPTHQEAAHELQLSFGSFVPSLLCQKSILSFFCDPPDSVDPPPFLCYTFFMPMHFATLRKVLSCVAILRHQCTCTRPDRLQPSRLDRNAITTFQAGFLL